MCFHGVQMCKVAIDTIVQTQALTSGKLSWSGDATPQYNTIQHNANYTTQCNTIQYNTIQYHIAQCNTTQVTQHNYRTVLTQLKFG